MTTTSTTIPLICPQCRSVTPERIDLRSLAPAHIGADVLACECGARYPVIDGVPIVLPASSTYLRDDIATIVERDLSPEVIALLIEQGPDDAPYARLAEQLSIYMDAHWGDCASPPIELASAVLIDRIAARAEHRVGTAVELGCSVGRLTHELARTADHTIGVELHFGMIRRARRIAAGERVAYGRRIVGRRYLPVHAQLAAAPTGRVNWVCADALDPPLVPGAFDRVVALNLLDSVSHPMQLLQVIDRLCAIGGEIILSSPFAWNSAVVADHARLGGADPAADLADLLQAGGELGRYRIEDRAELPWTLRRDARSDITYRTHYLRARKERNAVPV